MIQGLLYPSLLRKLCQINLIRKETKKKNCSSERLAFMITDKVIYKHSVTRIVYQLFCVKVSITDRTTISLVRIPTTARGRVVVR